ncbi:hypothetical protein H8E77_30600 [bacterium]|nr:hypothetical protein [bacterium]
MNLQFWCTGLSNSLNNIMDTRTLFSELTEVFVSNLEDYNVRGEYRNKLEQLIQNAEENCLKEVLELGLPQEKFSDDIPHKKVSSIDFIKRLEASYLTVIRCVVSVVEAFSLVIEGIEYLNKGFEDIASAKINAGQQLIALSDDHVQKGSRLLSGIV